MSAEQEEYFDSNGVKIVAGGKLTYRIKAYEREFPPFEETFPVVEHLGKLCLENDQGVKAPLYHFIKHNTEFNV